MDDKIHFEAGDKFIKDVLFATNKFQIPRYQRPYAWEEDQISEFWNDIISSEVSPFIGSLIFNYEYAKKTGYIDVIDGQQRLLSVTIFIAVLRDIAKKFDDKQARLYQRQDITIEDRMGGESVRILCGDSTKDFFLKNVQNYDSDILNVSPGTKEEARIKKSYEFLHTKVNNVLEKFSSNSDKISELNRLRDKVANLLVIQIEIENEEEAYEIFETTNARGIDLSVADLLKNLIFQAIRPKDEKDLAKDIWQEIVNDVQATETEMKRFIRYFWISKYAFVTEKKLFKAIKREITDWEKLLNDLWHNSQLFNKLLDGGEDEWKDFDGGYKLYDSLFAIRLMGVSQCYVLLLSILRNYEKIKTDPSRIFKLIEKFTFQYAVICKMPGNVVEKIYSKYALQIERAVVDELPQKISGKIQSIFSDLEKDLKKEMPVFESFRKAFMEFEYKNSERYRMLIKYYLGRVNSHYSTTKETKIDYNNVNIEHLLPQKPHKDWGLSGEDIKEYVNKLGNLTLVDKRINSKLQNKLIKDKIVELEKSTLPITSLIVQQLIKNRCKWGEKEIRMRHDHFAELAYKEVFAL